MINSENAHEITSFDFKDPISLIDYYYASRIRGDEQWRKVVGPPESWSGRMQRTLEKQKSWNYLAYENKGFQGNSEKYITVYFKVSINGRTDAGENEVEVKKNGDEWVIVKVPG